MEQGLPKHASTYRFQKTKNSPHSFGYPSLGSFFCNCRKCPGGEPADRKILDRKNARARSPSRSPQRRASAKSLFLLLSRKIGAESEPDVDELTVRPVFRFSEEIERRVMLKTWAVPGRVERQAAGGLVCCSRRWWCYERSRHLGGERRRCTYCAA